MIDKSVSGTHENYFYGFYLSKAKQNLKDAILLIKANVLKCSFTSVNYELSTIEKMIDSVEIEYTKVKYISELPNYKLIAV
jgi:hypothetical protein